MKEGSKFLLLVLAAVAAATALAIAGGMPLPLTAVLNRIFAMNLVALLLVVSGSLGARVFTILLKWDQRDECALQFYALGMGLLGTALFVLGSLFAFSPGMILLVFLAAAWFGRDHLSQGLAFLRLPAALYREWRRSDGTQKILHLLALMIMLTAWIAALVPPYAYDALMYHLRAPQLFLAEGQIRALPEIWQASGPLLIQMLYGAGLAAGSDLAPALLQFSTGVMLLVAVFDLARRLGEGTSGWFAVAVLLGVPAFPLWSAIPYADVSWAFFQFLSLDALLRWRKEGEQGWLFLAGAQLGFALGSKYLALGYAVAIALFFLLPFQRRPFRERLRALVCIAIAAVAVSAPWFVRNALVLGNPVFPFYFGGLDWDMERVHQLLGYMHSFGRMEWGGLAAFWDIFVNPTAYRTMGLERLNPLFLAALLVLLPSMRKKYGVLGFFLVVPLVFWGFGSRQIRFLLPMMPVAAVVAGQTVQETLLHLRARWRLNLLFQGVLMAFMGMTLFMNLAIVWELQFARVIVGAETREAFLARSVYDYPAIQAALAELEPGEQVLFLWDGQGYYCGERCIADADQAGWINLQREYGSHQAIAAALRTQERTILLAGKGDAAWMAEHDPTGAQADAYEDFLGLFVPAYTIPLYEDDQILIVRLVDGP